jgi:hypothetical protein
MALLSLLRLFGEALCLLAFCAAVIVAAMAFGG